MLSRYVFYVWWLLTYIYVLESNCNEGQGRDESEFATTELSLNRVPSRNTIKEISM